MPVFKVFIYSCNAADSCWYWGSYSPIREKIGHQNGIHKLWKGTGSGLFAAGNIFEVLPGV
jgi:hypothetical protein